MAERVITFRNTRARFMCDPDGIWLAGWTTHLGHDEVRVQLKAFTPVREGASVHGECYGDGARVRFSGSVVVQQGQDVVIRTTGSLVFDKHHESIRISVEGVTGRIETDAGPLELLVVDVSPESLGGLVAMPLPMGKPLDLVIGAGPTDLRCRAEVVNFRADAIERGIYRVGLRVSGFSRLDAPRWTRFIEERAAA